MYSLLSSKHLQTNCSICRRHTMYYCVFKLGGLSVPNYTFFSWCNSHRSIDASKLYQIIMNHGCILENSKKMLRVKSSSLGKPTQFMFILFHSLCSILHISSITQHTEVPSYYLSDCSKLQKNVSNSIRCC